MKAYDLDLRERVVEARAEGMSIAQSAKRFKVSGARVKRCQTRARNGDALCEKTTRQTPAIRRRSPKRFGAAGSSAK